ncbi:MAG: hypothetical protein M0R74_16675 [Dehalococcoidia bacterium]|nr:hypothetical protein [Dehalococcoidia bacterium]
MTEIALNYETDTFIDMTALDIEWLRQPDLMLRYARYMAEAKKGLDEAKERLDVGKARIEMNIRTYPESFNLSKLTEGAIQSTLLLQEEYQKLSKEYIDARYEYDVAAAAVRAIDQKKTALENLVRLLGASYFAGPQVPRDLTSEWLQENQRRGTSNSYVRIKRRERREKT